MNPWAFWRLVGGFIAAIALVAMRGLSLWPLGAPAGDASVRLSWSARPERVEACRRLTDGELAALPEHMRLRVQCEGRLARYLLTVTVDSHVVVSDTVRGGGLRNDRPIHLLREYRVPTGSHRLVVALVRVDSTGPRAVTGEETGGAGALNDRSVRERDERDRRAGEALPERLELDTTLAFARGRVVLVTYLNEQRRLAVGARE